MKPNGGTQNLKGGVLSKVMTNKPSREASSFSSSALNVRGKAKKPVLNSLKRAHGR